MKYLSEEWLDAVAAAAARVDVDPPAPTGAIVVQTIVTDGTAGEIAYHVLLEGSSLAVRRGRVGDATVTFTQTAETAAAVASGRRSAQEAFMAGDIRVGGDVTALIDHREPLASLDQVMAEIRENTEF